MNRVEFHTMTFHLSSNCLLVCLSVCMYVWLFCGVLIRLCACVFHLSKPKVVKIIG